MSGYHRPNGAARKTTQTTIPPIREFADLRVKSSGDVPTVKKVKTNRPNTVASSSARVPETTSTAPRALKEGDRWYETPGSRHPYEIAAIITDPPHSTPRTWHHASYFPWALNTPTPFINYASPAEVKPWKEKQKKWASVLALCGGDEVRLIKTSPKESYQVILSLHLDAAPGEGEERDREDGTLSDRARAFTWAVDPEDLSVLLCFGGSGRLIYVYDLDAGKYRSCIRGHGQTIMHLTTHPLYPYIIASSSRDRSTRIYDLTLTQSFPITYAPLADGMPNRGNFPMGGLPVTKDGKEGVEADGPGKCIAVVGWYVKGHRDAVVGADFHPTLPLLATCGLDHAVRIWALPKLPIPKDEPWEMCAISDPLFGTRLIHSSPLDSIYWLGEDILVSKSWDDYTNHDGTVMIWQWTELDRFFPLLPPGSTALTPGAAETSKGKDRPKPARARQEIYWERNREPFDVRTWDVDNSRSYRELLRLRPTPQAIHTRLALHHPFKRAPNPNSGQPTSVGIVDSLLLAWGETGASGEVWLVNPLLKLPAREEGVEEGRVKIKPEPTEASLDGSHLLGKEPPPLPEVGDKNAGEMSTERRPGEMGWRLADKRFGEVAERVPGLREVVREAEEAEAEAARAREEKEREKEKGKPKGKEREREVLQEGGLGVTVQVVAVRPGGARWVVGAGEHGLILVWRMKVD